MLPELRGSTWISEPGQACPWKFDLHEQPGAGVLRGDRAPMQVDGAPGDGQPQPDAAAGSAAIAFDPDERLEDRARAGRLVRRARDRAR